MRKISVLIVEDEPLYADQLEMLLDKLGYILFGVLDESTDVLARLDVGIPDLILMDVHIKGVYDGIELTEKIHERFALPVIFITSLKDDMTFNRASRTDAVNFIVKPFDELQLQRAIELALKKNILSQDNNEMSSANSENHFFVRQNQSLERVDIQDVLFVEADVNYCVIHLKDRKHVLKMSLTELSKRLPSNRFLLTHRSYLVNREKISTVNLKEGTVLVGGTSVPLSRRNKAMVLKTINYFRD